MTVPSVEISDSAALPRVPVVSVVMLTYNHASYLADAIDGVVGQCTDFPIELLVGEDCSTDDTRAVALRYQQQYPHVVRVLTADRNVGAQRNLQRLLEAARGQFVAFCDGDDYWIAPDKLAKQVAALRARPDMSICCHSAWSLDHASQRIVRQYWTTTVPTDLSLQAVIAGAGGIVHTSTMVIRRDAVCPVDEWLLSCSFADFPLRIWAASKGVFHVLPDVMSVYRRGTPGSWNVGNTEIATFWRNLESAIVMLEAFPRKAARPDAEAPVKLLVREFLRDFHLEFGAQAAGDFQGKAELESRLTWSDRVYVRACHIRPLLMLLRLTSEARQRWRRAFMARTKSGVPPQVPRPPAHHFRTEFANPS